MTAATTVDVDQLLAEVTELAVGMQRLKLDASEDTRRRRRPESPCGARHHGTLMYAGYVTGLCIAIARITGEHPDDVETRIVESAPC